MNSDGFVDTKFSDSESDNPSESETQNVIKAHKASMKKQNAYYSAQEDSDIFVICKNNIPILYCKDDKSASDHILQLAWEEKGAKILENSDYNYYIVVESQSLVYLCCTFKNWLLSYDNTLSEFSYHKIKNLNK